MPEITHAWVPILKAEKNADGTVTVIGPMSDAGKDRDGQAMNQAWLDTAAPRWYDESGNIREQHDRHRAAGVGSGLMRTDDGTWVLQSRIVDPVAALKCLPGPNGERPVYQGYSIGVRQPQISFQKAEFPAGEVVGGYICEVSLADRPSNPRSIFTMVKADDAGNPVVMELADADGNDKEPDGDADDVPETVGYDGPDRVTPNMELQPNVTNPGGAKPGKKPKKGQKPAVKKDEAPALTKDWAEFDAERGYHPRVPGEGNPLTEAEAHAAAGARHWAQNPNIHGASNPIKRGTGIPEHASQPSVRVGDKVNFPHPTGGRATGHVIGFHSDSSGHHVDIAHGGEVHRVNRNDVSAGQAATYAHLPTSGGSGGGGPHGQHIPFSQNMGTGRGADVALSPENVAARQAAEAHADIQQAGNQALGEGAFNAAIRQATAANARGRTKFKAETPDLMKFVSRKQRKKYAKQGVAMPNGDFPIPDVGHLQSALGHLGGYTGDREAAKAHIQTRAHALGVQVHLDGDGDMDKIESLHMLTKAAGWLLDELLDLGTVNPEEIEDMDKTETAAMITAALTDFGKGLEQRLGDQIAALVGRVEKVEASPVPGGPSVRRLPGQSQLAKNVEVKQVQDEIASLEHLAILNKAEDPELARGYSDQAQELRERLIH